MIVLDSQEVARTAVWAIRMSGEAPVAGKRKSPGPIHSKAQQGFLFATHKTFAKRWAREAGETGPRGNPASKAAYARLPRRKGPRKKA